MTDATLADAALVFTPGTRVHCGGLLLGEVVRPVIDDTRYLVLEGIFHRGQDGKLMVPVRLDGSRHWTWWGVCQCTPI